MGMSREEEFIMGVPQGTVLAAILFVIMISDIDEDVKMCIIRCFADDTRVNKEIKTNEEREPMIKLFNSYIKSKLKYCCVIWSPSTEDQNQEKINAIEKIQQAFTKMIEGLENLDYHQRLKECNLYSMDQRRERYMIIYAWQMLEDIKTDVLGLQKK